MKNRSIKGFTLSEVLITLAIIGVIAAILFPSILANYNERTLKAKRQALFGRMSQAMGEMADQFRNYESVSCSDLNDPTTCTDAGSTIKFLNEGFSKVYKVAAVCDSDSLSACDIPTSITREDGSTFDLTTNGISMLAYNKSIELNALTFPYDTKSAGVITKNGESLLVWYNPLCQIKTKAWNRYNQYTEQQYCVNILYDLNGGKNKPNRFGEDIGFITVFYNDQPYVATARPFDWKGVPDYDTTTNASGETVKTGAALSTFTQAKAACAALGDNVGLPSKEEAMAMQLNRELWAPQANQDESGNVSGNWIWTSSLVAPSQTWIVFLSDNKRATDKYLYIQGNTFSSGTKYAVRCVYKD